MKPRVEVTRITTDISDAVARFFRKVWTDTATGESVRLARAEAAHLNPAVPGADVPAVVYFRDGEVIGHLGTIPVKFWNGRVETAGHWLNGFMVLPEHQNGSVGFAVLKEMLKYVDVTGAMTVALPARRLFQAVGFVDCGVIPNFVSLLRGGRVARSIDIANLGLGLPPWLHRCARAAQKVGLARAAGGMAGMGFRAWRALRGSSIRLSTDLSGELPSRSALDDLWARARPNILASAVRDGSFLSWRYQARAGSKYEAVAVYERASKKSLVAIAVVRSCSDASDQRLRGIRVATVADILFRVDEPAAGLAALAGAESVAHRMGADAILCSAAHPAITSALRRRAYLRLPGNVHLMLRDPAGAMGLPLAVDQWWLMRGDAKADDAF
ncbi:MAG TPA: GNAT family N-acetyltransferase [Gemmatimonadaceae bacterium]